MLITSSSNERVKRIKKLIKSSRERKNQGVYVVEGIRMVREIPADILEEIYVSEDSRYRYEDFLKNVPDGVIYEVKSQVFDSMSDTGSPQGIMALAKIRQYELEDVFGDKPFILIIEKLQDPGNLGTILRTAEAAGVTGIVMSSDSVDIYNPKVVRSTMGSIFRMPVYVTDDLPGQIDILKGRNVTIYGAHLKGYTFFDRDFSIPCGFLIGNEGNGLSDKVSAKADVLLRIPMLGKVESLNAATSTAVISYEVLRQRKFS